MLNLGKFQDKNKELRNELTKIKIYVGQKGSKIKEKKIITGVAEMCGVVCQISN